MILIGISPCFPHLEIVLFLKLHCVTRFVTRATIQYDNISQEYICTIQYSQVCIVGKLNLGSRIRTHMCRCVEPLAASCTTTVLLGGEINLILDISSSQCSIEDHDFQSGNILRMPSCHSPSPTSSTQKKSILLLLVPSVPTQREQLRKSVRFQNPDSDLTRDSETPKKKSIRPNSP